MILIHTADWHIGQYFYGYDRKNEHLYFFNWLKNTIKQYNADVLLVAGDIFDSPNPSAESQKIYYRFLYELCNENKNLQTVIIAGNHDSAARLESPKPLLEEMNINVKGIIERNTDNEIDYSKIIIPLKKGGEIQAWCMAVPYLRQGDIPACENYSQGVALFYNNLYDELEKCRDNKPVVVMGHLQATGSSLSENDRSERAVIGGLECVTPEIFDKEGMVYTALGHLHKSQYVSGREQVRYSGTPLPMSFAEKNYKQGINLVEIDHNGLVKIERIDFEPPVKLLSIPKEPKPLKEVLEEIASLPDGEINFNSPYVELKVLITEPEPSMRNQINEALKNKSVRLTSAVPFRQKGTGTDKSITYEEMKAINPMDIAEDIFLKKYNNPMPEGMKTLLQSVISEVGK